MSKDKESSEDDKINFITKPLGYEDEETDPSYTDQDERLFDDSWNPETDCLDEEQSFEDLYPEDTK